MTRSDDDAVLEILDAGPGAGWSVAPGSRAEYPLLVRNGTDEWHDVEVTIAEPIDWISVKPARISLPPGAQTRTSVIFALPQSTSIVAGQHAIRLELHDFEGTCFGQVVSSINVLPAYDLEMSLSLRGPLTRRDVVDGIVMRCQLLNRGNGECSVALRIDPHVHASIQPQSVRVPPGAQTAFDIEARWDSDVLPSYPSSVTVYAAYQGGDVSASVPWSEIAWCLGTALPPAAPPEEFPAILVSHTVPQSPAQTSPPGATSPPAAPQHAGRSPAQATPALHVEITAPPRGPRGRRLHPWWPPVERFAGRLVVKTRFAAAVLAVISIVVLALHAPQHGANGPAPLGSLTAIASDRGSHRGAPRVPSIAAFRQAMASHRAHTAASQSAVTLPYVNLPNMSPPRVSQRQDTRSAPVAKAARKTHAPVPQLEWDVWSGPISHASSGNVKVYDPAHHAWRSFILLPGFDAVFAAGSHRQVPLTRLRTGSWVQVFYSYSLGIRRAREIDLLTQR